MRKKQRKEKTHGAQRNEKKKGRNEAPSLQRHYNRIKGNKWERILLESEIMKTPMKEIIYKEDKTKLQQ